MPRKQIRAVTLPKEEKKPDNIETIRQLMDLFDGNVVSIISSYLLTTRREQAMCLRIVSESLKVKLEMFEPDDRYYCPVPMSALKLAVKLNSKKGLVLVADSEIKDI